MLSMLLPCGLMLWVILSTENVRLKLEEEFAEYEKEHAEYMKEYRRVYCLPEKKDETS